MRSYILQQGCQISGFIISDNYDPKDFMYLDQAVYRISEMPEDEDMYLILATPALEVFEELLEKRMCFEFFSEKFYQRIGESTYVRDKS